MTLETLWSSLVHASKAAWPRTFVAIYAFFDLFAPLVVGVIVLVAAIALSPQLLSGLLRGWDRLRNMWRMVKLACPNAGCYQPVALPVYICPTCGAKHERLEPEAMYLWQRPWQKKCTCGRILPTMGTERDALPSRCPHCDKPMSVVKERTIRIPLIGGASAGKSSFLMANMGEFYAQSQAGRIGLNFPEARNRTFFEGCHDRLQTGTPLLKTPDFAPDALVTQLKDLVGNTCSLHLYDAKGELFNQADSLRGQEYIRHSDAIALLIDPFSLPQVKLDHRQELQTTEDKIRPCELHPQDALERVLSTMREMGHLKEGKSSIPVGVVVTKADALGLLQDIHGNDQATTISRSDSGKVRDWLRRNGEANLVRTLETNFRHVHYFACSALGRLPDETDRPFVPRGVVHPTAWLLARFGIQMEDAVADMARQRRALVWAARVAAVLAVGTFLMVGDAQTYRLVAPWLVYAAAEKGHAGTLSTLLDVGAKVDYRTESGETPLMRAAAHGRAEAMALLLKRGANPNAADQEGFTALMRAGMANSEEGVRSLLSFHAAVNVEDRYGEAALTKALAPASLGVLKQLLIAGANPNAMSSGKSPLIMQCLDMIAGDKLGLLLSFRANANAKSRDGTPALCKAVVSKWDSAVSLLLKHGARPDLPDARGQVPLVRACGDQWISGAKLLLEAGASPNVRTVDGEPLLIRALSQKWYPGAKALVAHHVNVNIRANSGETALYQAVRLHPLEVVEDLLRHGAAPNLRNRDGGLPIYHAVGGGMVAESQSLLSHGARTDLREQGRVSLFEVAIQSPKDEIIRLLAQHPEGLNVRMSSGQYPLFWALEAGKLDYARWFIREGCSVSIHDANGMSPVHWAMKTDNGGLFQWLTKRRGALSVRDAGGNTPLLWAINSRKTYVEPLLAAGSPVNGRNQQGVTPLLAALQRSDTALAERLLHKGANPNLADRSGITPLHLAAKMGARDLVAQMLDRGANRYGRTQQGQTPAEFARWGGYGEIVNLLDAQ